MRPSPSRFLGHGGAATSDTLDTSDGAAVDADGDGAVAADDCDDADPAVSPGANDICQDSVDQDCDGVERACEDRRLKDADAMLFGDAGWGVASGHVAVVGSRVVAVGSSDQGGAVLVSGAVPRGTDVFGMRMEGPERFGGVATMGDEEVLLAGNPMRVVSIDAESTDEARLWYEDVSGGGGSRPQAGQMVEGEATDLVFSADGARQIVNGDQQGAVSVADGTVTGEDTSLETFVVGDGDGDGFDELVLVGNYYSTAYIFEGPITGVRALEDADLSYPSSYFYATWVGDLDGDGRADLGGCTDSFRVFSLVGRVEAFADFPASWCGRGVGDVNADGYGDLLAFNDDDSAGGARLGLHRGPFAGAVEEETGQLFSDGADADVDLWVKSGDLDADGLSDFVLGLFAPNSSYVRGDRAWLLFYGSDL